MFTSLILVMLLFVSYRSSGQTFQLLLPSQTGITFRNDIHENDTMNILVDFYMFNGGGVGVGDVDKDGLLDIVFSSTQRGVSYFKNLGGMRFSDRSVEAGLIMPDSSQNTGVLISDLNGDGWLDVYISRRYAPNRVFMNNRNGSFRDETATSPLGFQKYTTQAVPLDYDKDGDLDLLMVNSGEPRRKGYLNPGVADILLRNDGSGRYTDVSSLASITDKGYGLSASVADFNDDGWPDVYVANDFEERDKLWMNRKDGTFEETAARRLPNMSWASMGSDAADINSDGRFDVVTVDMLPRDNYRRQTQLGGMSIYGPFFDSLQRVNNTFQLNRGDAQFVNIGHLSGMAASDWSWSILAQDFDLDADVDLFISNGTKRDLGDQDFAYNFLSNPSSYRADAYRMMPSTRLPNTYLANVGSVRDYIGFEPAIKQSGLTDSVISNGAAYGDFDNDGDMDLILNNTDTVAFLYENLSAGESTSWVGIVLDGGPNNIQGIGTRIRWSITSASHHRTVTQECYGVRGFHSTSDTRLVVALSPYEVIDSVNITWSDGATSSVRSITPKRYNIVRRPEAVLYGYSNYAVTMTATPAPIFTRLSDTVLPFKHRENLYDDFKRERLIPYRFSKDGPALAVGDVNGDRLADVVTAGAKYQPTQCFLQRTDGTFEAYECGLDDAIESEDIDLVLFDIDNDRDLDLVVVTGGSEFDADDAELFDRVYLNDGKGQFTRKQGELSVSVAGSCVAHTDFDNDGDIDMFIGGRVVPGRFPETAPSSLYANVNGRFVDVTDSVAPGLKLAGMTSSATWVDIDNDRDNDLVVVGEWMSPRVWQNQKGRFTEITAQIGLDSLEGWWSVVRSADIDGDGDQDLIVGNVGTNCQFTPAPGAPIECFADDFDENGSIDPLMFRYVDGKQVPTRGRTTIIAHMPTMTRRFTTYSAFARATIDSIITLDQRSGATHLVVREFASGVLRNQGATFRFEPFDEFAQVAPIRDVLPMDADKDGDVDIVAVGNTKTADGDNVAYDGGIGLLMLNNGSGAFTSSLVTESGIAIRRECRRIAIVPRKGKPDVLCVTTNSSAPVLFVRDTR